MERIRNNLVLELHVPDFEQEQAHQTSDQNMESQDTNPQAESYGEFLFKSENFVRNDISYVAILARNKQEAIVFVKSIRPENGQEIPQKPKRTVRRSRFC